MAFGTGSDDMRKLIRDLRNPGERNSCRRTGRGSARNVTRPAVEKASAAFDKTSFYQGFPAGYRLQFEHLFHRYQFSAVVTERHQR